VILSTNKGGSINYFSVI